MNVKVYSLRAGALAALLSLAAGCSVEVVDNETCLTRCEAQVRGGCSPVSLSACEAVCDTLQTQASTSGCGDQADATQRCLVAGDACDTARCDAEADAYVACFSAFCDANPDSDVCPSRP